MGRWGPPTTSMYSVTLGLTVVLIAVLGLLTALVGGFNPFNTLLFAVRLVLTLALVVLLLGLGLSLLYRTRGRVEAVFHVPVERAREVLEARPDILHEEDYHASVAGVGLRLSLVPFHRSTRVSAWPLPRRARVQVMEWLDDLAKDLEAGEPPGMRAKMSARDDGHA